MKETGSLHLLEELPGDEIEPNLGPPEDVELAL